MENKDTGQKEDCLSDHTSASSEKRGHNQRRSERRAKCQGMKSINPNGRVEIISTLQVCSLRENKIVLEDELQKAKSEGKQQKLRGLLYVLEQLLLSTTDINSDSCKMSIRSFMPFHEALEYYLAFQPLHSEASTNDQRETFRDALLHETHGLKVNIICLNNFGLEYIVLKPDDIDLELMYLAIFDSIDKEENTSSCDSLDKETIQSIIGTMDTEWDKSCVKVILRNVFSREQMRYLGFDPNTLPAMTEKVNQVVKEVQNANEAAKDLVKLRLEAKKNKLEKEIREKRDTYEKKKCVWSNKTLSDIQDNIQVLSERKTEIEKLLDSECTDDASFRQRKSQMLKRQANSLIEEHRLKRRKLTNQGPKLRLDDDDEEFIAKSIEDKASYHGRRHDTVMYTNQRVKKKNLLSIANFRLLQKGEKMIRSATTVYNRGKPKHTRSVQAKRHLGKGLFCWKKPPKGEESTNENTHYQRAHVKNIKKRFFGSKHVNNRKFCFMRSTDDKAYIRPGTSEGFDKARNVRVLTLSDETKARKLPKYDWPEKMVYVTPGSHRIFSKTSVTVEGEEKLLTDNDDHHVFVRPKSLVGSSGSVWASETVRLRYEDPLAFEVERDHTIYPNYSVGFRKCCARFHDDLFLYCDMTEPTDVEKISEKRGCEFFIYEQKRIEHLKVRIDKMLEFSNEVEMEEQDRKVFASRIIPSIEVVTRAINDFMSDDSESAGKSIKVNQINNLEESCKRGLDLLSDLQLKPVKPLWADLTDAGPGVGVSNYEVRFRDAELARVHNSDYRVRCHRSRGDSGQGEAERTNSAISDALVDGATLQWEKYRRFEDLTSEEIEQMSLEDYEKYERQRMEKNAWYVTGQISERIDDAPVLKDYIQSRVSEPLDEMFFFNSCYLHRYQKAAVNTKSKVPGAAYYTKVEKFMETHYVRGELFMEFCRNSCAKESDAPNAQLCSWCKNHPWVGPPMERIPQPIPDKENPGHYLDVDRTAVKNRKPDDHLPRKCLKDQFANKSISTDDVNGIKSFSEKYCVEEKYVINYLCHLKDLEHREEIRSREKKEKKKREMTKGFNDFPWDEIIEEGKLGKLLVRELDLYLKRHGLTTAGKKNDKLKAIRCHFYRQTNKESTAALPPEEEDDDDDTSDGDTEEENFESEDEEGKLNEETTDDEDDDEDSDDDFVICDLDEIQFIPDGLVPIVHVKNH